MSFGFPELIFSVENHIICPTNLWHKWALISLIFYKNSLYCCSIDFYKGWVNQTLSQLVTIKGTRSGIILVLDPEVDFSTLIKEVGEKFKEASSFLGKNNMGMIIRGRKLSESEEDEVLKSIKDNSMLTITCIIDEESDIQRKFENVAASNDNVDPEINTNKKADSVVNVDQNSALIYKGSLRSGQDISCEQSIVILGDVKPGANVISYGSIFILGELRGNAFAGAGGDKDAVVMALGLNPLQVRIADSIAISPESEKSAKLKLGRKKPSVTENEPEVAYIENGHIVKSVYGSSFLRQFNM